LSFGGKIGEITRINEMLINTDTGGTEEKQICAVSSETIVCDKAKFHESHY